MINTIIVCGLGAIGSNVLLQLSKVYLDKEYIGIDFDKVEARNIGPQAYFREHIGQLKTVAMNGALRRFTPSIKYFPVNLKVNKPEDIYGLPQTRDKDPSTILILDCFDNVEARNVTKQCISYPVYHIGFNVEYCAELFQNKDYELPKAKNPNEADICTLVDATPFIHFVSNFAAMQVCEKIETGEFNNFRITNKWKIRKI
jgi:hypothetical protein